MLSILRLMAISVIVLVGTGCGGKEAKDLAGAANSSRGIVATEAPNGGSTKPPNNGTGLQHPTKDGSKLQK